MPPSVKSDVLCTSSLLDSHMAQFVLEIVMDHHQVCLRHFWVSFHERPNGLTRKVHVGFGQADYGLGVGC